MVFVHRELILQSRILSNQYKCYLNSEGLVSTGVSVALLCSFKMFLLLFLDRIQIRLEFYFAQPDSFMHLCLANKSNFFFLPKEWAQIDVVLPALAQLAHEKEWGNIAGIQVAVFSVHSYPGSVQPGNWHISVLGVDSLAYLKINLHRFSAVCHMVQL